MSPYSIETKPQFSQEDLAVNRWLVVDAGANFLLAVLSTSFGSDLQPRTGIPQAPVKVTVDSQFPEVNNYQTRIEQSAKVPATPAITESAELVAYNESLKTESTDASVTPNLQTTSQEVLISAARQELTEAYRNGTV